MGEDRVRTAYDRVARAYDARLRDELDARPLDRALLSALAELGRGGTLADVGCGPGHVTRFLAERHADVVGIDLSPEMVAVARERSPGLRFTVGSMLALPVPDGAWAAAAALYSVIHLTAEDRAGAVREMARALRPGGWLLLAFHVDSPDFAAGDVNHLTSWFDQPVDLDGYFLDPADVRADVVAAGLEITAAVERQPHPDAEYPSRRCHLLARRPEPPP